MRERTGCIYREMVNPGRQYRRGVGLCKNWKARYVGEIMINHKRHRFRSTNYNNVCLWLERMLAQYKYY